MNRRGFLAMGAAAAASSAPILACGGELAAQVGVEAGWAAAIAAVFANHGHFVDRTALMAARWRP